MLLQFSFNVNPPFFNKNREPNAGREGKEVERQHGWLLGLHFKLSRQCTVIEIELPDGTTA